MTAETPAHGSLIEALLAFQAEAPNLHKDKANGAFKGVKYLSLDSLTDTVRPLLTKHGLVWVTMPDSYEGGPALSYQLLHASGEAIKGTMPLILSKQDAQGQGSAITYARRYALMAVLNLVADEDDDGNSASQRQSATNLAPKMATVKDVKEITEAAKGMSTQQVKLALAACGIPNVEYYEDVPAAKVAPLIIALAGARE